MNFQVFKLVLVKEGTRDQIANIPWIIKKAREFQKSIYFCFIDYTKTFVWITTNCGKFLKRWEYRPSDLPLEKPYAGQEATVRTGHGTTDWLFYEKKEYIKAVYCHPAYLTYMQSIMQNARLDEAQAGIKTARRNINNLRYADDTTLWQKVKRLFSFPSLSAIRVVSSAYLRLLIFLPAILIPAWAFSSPVFFMILCI